jgi:hypothetical protein
MKALNAKVAVILTTMGAVLLMVSLTPSQGGVICSLSTEACAQVSAQGAQTAAIQFFAFFFSGLASISIAALLLISGRNRGPSVSLGSS